MKQKIPSEIQNTHCAEVVQRVVQNFASILMLTNINRVFIKLKNYKIEGRKSSTGMKNMSGIVFFVEKISRRMNFL